MMRAVLVALIAGFLGTAAMAAPLRLSEKPVASGVSLVGAGGVAEIVHSSDEAPLIGIAANDLSSDIALVTGKSAVVTTPEVAKAPQQVWIGTLGHNGDIDALIAKGRIDAKRLKNCWECYLIVTVAKPKAGVDAALIIIGSDRRGAAYGVYEISQAIGVSPWHWWADVAPMKRAELHVAAIKSTFGPPSVKYRGIFINDEDWGLFPWAAKTFEPKVGNIGPKTYTKVFELLLRLKANTLWPAMHKVSAPFNNNPENAKLADRYGIVMGASHAEPMLRNNVGEWKDAPDRFNYAINAEGVKAYWAERLKTNGGYENLYTLGMRGIHDSGIVGATTLEGRQALLNRIIADQRQLLAEHVGKPETIGQIFVPYKEVLDIYRAGLAIPEDVTIVWPDDNFGYIRHFPDAKERLRKGGSGVYYHLSYLGAPLSYLWLSTTPPALINEEMTRAYDHGADRLWIANVGDIKPAEVSLSYFLDLAWDVKGVRGLSQADYLKDFAARTFGTERAGEIASVWDRYYRLNFERRPEHLQGWLPGEKPRRMGWEADEVANRLSGFEALISDLDRLKAQIPTAQMDGFFEMIDYPVRASALANQRFFALEAYATTYEANPPIGMAWAHKARTADQALKALTHAYNHDIQNGKWAGILNEEPADGLWTSFRLSPPILPAEGLSTPGAVGFDARPSDRLVYEAEDVKARKDWVLIEGLGRGAGALRAAKPGANLSLKIDVPKAGDWCLRAHVLPTFPTREDKALSLEIGVDGKPVQTLSIPRDTQDKVWTQGVLNNRISFVMALALAKGTHMLVARSPVADLVLDGFALEPATSEACR